MLQPTDSELISAYLDDEVSAAERQRAEHLLATEPEARQLLEELRGLRSQLAALPAVGLPEDLTDRVLRRAEREMLRRAEPVLAGADDRAAPWAQPSDGPQPASAVAAGHGWSRARRPAIALAMTLAAALLVMLVGRRPVERGAQAPSAEHAATEPANSPATPRAAFEAADDAPTAAAERDGGDGLAGGESFEPAPAGAAGREASRASESSAPPPPAARGRAPSSASVLGIDAASSNAGAEPPESAAPSGGAGLADAELQRRSTAARDRNAAAASAPVEPRGPATSAPSAPLPAAAPASAPLIPGYELAPRRPQQPAAEASGAGAASSAFFATPGGANDASFLVVATDVPSRRVAEEEFTRLLTRNQIELAPGEAEPQLSGAAADESQPAGEGTDLRAMGEALEERAAGGFAAEQPMALLVVEATPEQLQGLIAQMSAEPAAYRNLAVQATPAPELAWSSDQLAARNVRSGQQQLERQRGLGLAQQVAPAGQAPLQRWLQEQAAVPVVPGLQQRELAESARAGDVSPAAQLPAEPAQGPALKSATGAAIPERPSSRLPQVAPPTDAPTTDAAAADALSTELSSSRGQGGGAGDEGRAAAGQAGQASPGQERLETAEEAPLQQALFLFRIVGEGPASADATPVERP